MFSPQVDEAVTHVYPLVLGEKENQRLLDLFGRRFVGEAYFSTETEYMSVDDKSRRDMERVAKDTVRGFSPDAWKLYQLFDRIWNFAVVFFDEYFGGL